MRHVIAHGHIFKNAGTTFDWSLGRVFGERFLDHRDDQAMRKEKSGEVLKVLDQHPLLSAFSSHALHADLPCIPGCNLIPVFMIRHPIARAASVYRFERAQEAATPGARKAKELDFKDYVRWRMRSDVAPTIRNFQCLFLASALTQRPQKGVDHQLFLKAMARIERTECVGIVEDYNRSMVWFENYLLEFFPNLDLSYITQNSSRDEQATLGRDISKVLDELGDVAPVLLRQNAYDMALYEASVEIMESRLSSIADVDAKCEAFAERCAALIDLSPSGSRDHADTDQLNKR